MPGLQVTPSSGQTGYHHHHMVAPLSGASSSSGAIFLTKLVIVIITYMVGATERCQFFKWRHLPDKTGYHHHHMVAPLSGARYSRGAIFRTKTGYHHHHMVAPLSGARSSSGAIFRTKLVIIIITWWRHLPDKTGYHHPHMVGATERCQFFK